MCAREIRASDCLAVCSHVRLFGKRSNFHDIQELNDNSINSRLVDTQRDVFRVSALGNAASRNLLVQYSNAVNKGVDEEVRAHAISIADRLLKGHMDADAAALWMMGRQDLIRYRQLHVSVFIK